MTKQARDYELSGGRLQSVDMGATGTRRVPHQSVRGLQRSGYLFDCPAMAAAPDPAPTIITNARLVNEGVIREVDVLIRRGRIEFFQLDQLIGQNSRQPRGFKVRVGQGSNLILKAFFPPGQIKDLGMDQFRNPIPVLVKIWG